jgi:hypothetical protein
MRHAPLRSTIEVYEVGGETRTYEGTTDDHNGFGGVKATQLSGPPLDIWVHEHRFKFWGGGAPEPEHPCRNHSVFWHREGRKYPEPMNELRTRGEVGIFEKNRATGELAYFIPRIGIVGTGDSMP